MKHLLTSFISLMSLTLLVCCSPRNEGKLSKLPSSSSKADSLTFYIHDRIHKGLFDDTTKAAIARLRPMGKTKEEELKCDYFTAMTFKDSEREDSTFHIMRNILANLDSAASPTLWHIAKSRLGFDTSLSYIERFSIYREELDHYTSVRDSAQMAVILSNMSNILFEILDFELSHRYLVRSQEIFKALGDTDIYIVNCVNEGILLHYLNRSKEAREIFESIIDKPQITRNKHYLEVSLQDMYKCDTTDYASLKRAYDICDSTMTSAKALDAALLSEYWMNRGNMDSASYYGHISYNLSKSGSSILLTNLADGIYPELLEREGKPDSAYYVLRKHLEVANSLETRENMSKIAAFELRQQQERYEMTLEQQKYRATMVRWLIVLCFVIFGCITVFLVYRHRQKDRLERIEADLEMERTKRHLAARALAIQEKDNLIDETRKRVSEMVDEGRMQRDVAREFESMISLHKSGQMEWEAFEKLMENVSPAFTRELKSRHPDLQPTAVRMAMYIYMGMSNQQIAQMLNIRQESVRQKRWRLARRLDVPEDTSLDDYLQSLG